MTSGALNQLHQQTCMNEPLSINMLCATACSNNTPIDMLGLYRAVVMHGGLTANEAYDPAGRYAGTINWVSMCYRLGRRTGIKRVMKDHTRLHRVACHPS